MILIPQSVVYRGTITDLRISSVDGTAFIDNLPSAVTDLAAADPGGYLLEIYDATGKVLRGYLGAVGDGETLGVDLLAAWDLTSGWTAGGTASIIDANSFSSTAAGWVYKNGIFVDHRLYKRTYAKSATGENYFHARTWNGATGNTPALSDGTDYYTANGTYVSAASTNLDAGTTDVSSMTVEQVLTPSTSGCLIVSTKGGANYNFAYKNAGFVYNAASYYVIVRKVR